MNKHQVQNPWGLTHAEVDTMDTLCALGTLVKAAERLNVRLHTFHVHMNRVRRKMDVHSTYSAIVLWTTWRVGPGKEVPA